jgi:hypothetical protein
MLEVIEPYERFLTTESAKLEEALVELRSAAQELSAVEQLIAEAFPEAPAEAVEGSRR